jgi:hypothetical protein
MDDNEDYKDNEDDIDDILTVIRKVYSYFLLQKQ